MKRFLITTALFFLTSNSFAGINANNGFYLGAEVGLQNYQLNKNSALSTNFSHIIQTPILARPFIGYRFNDYFALEMGYDDIENDSNSGGQPGIIAGTFYGPDHYRLYAIDFEGKFIYPFQNNLSLFTKLGAAFAHQSIYNQLYIGKPPLIDSTTNNLLPLAGVGISFNYTQNWASDLTYVRYFGNGNVGDIYTFGLSVRYTFG